MKKYLFILYIFLISQIGFAQTFGGGIFAGLSASQLDGDLSGGYNKAGLSFGIYTNVMLNKYIDAQLELKYIQKGSNNKSEDINSLYVSKLNYIELPVFLKYRFLNKFSANVGIAAGYLQKASETKGGIDDDPDSKDFNTFEFSGIAGVEYQISNRFLFNVRFNYSILPIRANPGDQTFFLNQGQYNNVLTFAVYYQLANSNPNSYAKRGKKDCDCDNRRKRFSIR
ncbi:MAG: porin family protein [Bacteroidales bacterium]|jgi:opacity protein-like surface antigen|nr:porin family protein [Bacteroidales bacterium]